LLSGLTSTPYDPATGAGEGLWEGTAEAVAEGELVRDELAAGEGALALPVPGTVQAPATSRASSPSAVARRDVGIIKGDATLEATQLCASGYVSGTILHLKQGTDPHPQSIARKGRGCGGWLQAVRFLFYLAELEE
jgi:hypothetical protein